MQSFLAKYLPSKGLELCPISKTQNDTGNSSRGKKKSGAEATEVQALKQLISLKHLS